MSKAILFREPGNDPKLELVNDWILPARQPGQIKIAVKSSSFNPIDAKVWRGVIAPSKLALPKAPGGDVAGVVIESDSDSQFKVGDAVIGLISAWGPWDPVGAWAEHTFGKETELAKAPTNISLNQEAGGIPLASLAAFQGLENCNLKKGSRILVTAASGGVGHFAVQLAKQRYRAYVVAMTSNPDFVEKLGADEIVDYTKEDFATKYKDQPFDAVLDLIGGDFEPKAYTVLAPGGTYGHVSNTGTDKARVEKAQKEWTEQKYTYTQSAPNGAQLQIISDLIQKGKVKVQVDSIVPLDTLAGAGEAQKLFGKKKQGKVVIKI